MTGKLAAAAVAVAMALLLAARLARYVVPIDPEGFGAPDDEPWRDAYLDDLTAFGGPARPVVDW